MAERGCEPTAAETPQQRHVLKIALALNATMFIVSVTAGVIARSSGLIADGLDMLASAIAYAMTLLAVGRASLFKANAARMSGWVLFVLAMAVVGDVGRRILTGEPPQGWIMIAVASVALVVNAYVLRMLTSQRSQEVHVRATGIFTRVDLMANMAVILSGVILILTGFRYIDLLVGAAIGTYVIKEAVEILNGPREAS